MPTGLNAATLIGEKVTVEPYAVLRSCRVEPKVIIGARSVVCEGAVVESESILAPNSVVPPARRIPSGELWGGSPAKFIRKLTDHEVGAPGQEPQGFTSSRGQGNRSGLFCLPAPRLLSTAAVAASEAEGGVVH